MTDACSTKIFSHIADILSRPGSLPVFFKLLYKKHPSYELDFILLWTALPFYRNALETTHLMAVYITDVYIQVPLCVGEFGFWPHDWKFNCWKSASAPPFLPTPAKELSYIDVRPPSEWLWDGKAFRKEAFLIILRDKMGSPC